MDQPQFQWMIVEAAPNAMIVVDRQRVVSFVNRSAETLFGYRRDELIGKPIELLIPDRFRAGHPSLVEGFLAAPTTRAMGAGRELFGLRKDGSEVPIEIGLNPIETPAGLFMLASIIDITERIRGDARFRLVVEAAPNAMVMADHNRTITLVNRRAEELFGFSRDELIGRAIEDLIPERFRMHHPDHVRDFFAAPDARAMGAGRDLFGRRKDGSEVPIEIGLNPIETPEGLFTLASIIDITERKRAEDVRQRMVALVESAADAILTKSVDGIVRSWNPGAERLLGYTAAEMIGQPVTRLLPPDRLDEEALILEQIRRGDVVAHFETVRQNKSGSLLDVSLTISPIRDRNGVIVGASKIMRDITDRKRAEDELRRSNADLEQFAYIASHDLQEPLRMVASYTALLEQRYRGKLDEKADKFIFYAVDGAKRMQRLVADLLEYSRVGSQGRPLAPTSAGAAFDRVLDVLRPTIEAAQIAVQSEALPDVLADEAQLGQIFQNLVGNAIKFRRSGVAARVEVGATLHGDRWRFRVSDNGIGIDKQYADRIFQMFQRLHERGVYDGSGIGLAIVRRILERHGGKIWFESQPDAGTTFFFTLLAAPAGRPA